MTLDRREPDDAPAPGRGAESGRVVQWLPFVLVGPPLILSVLGWLVGFPPRSVTRTAVLGGAAFGAAAYAALLLRGWRNEWVWYPVEFGMFVLGAAMIALAGTFLVHAL